MGGEEFVVALPETNASSAMDMAEQLRLAIAENPIRIPGHRGPVGVTVSIGVAAWPEHGEEISRLLERADNRLYEAKLAGRDQVKGPGSQVSLESPGRFQRGSLRPV
jgi:diguanylate cyclase (GGDEF)-like protein